ncbi:MAG: beta-lactamase family protein [Clostridia bacterium]|nr:beta-lactamase family protein [Clostridia bacterium]
MINTVHDKLIFYISENHIAGASIIVRRSGEIIHEEYLGHADIAAGIPISPSTIFRLASMTKPVIGVAVMQLVEKGLVSLDDELAKYIPEFADMQVASEQIVMTPDSDVTSLMAKAAEMTFVPLKRPIIIEDLLRHRSGIGQGLVSISRGINNNVPGITLAQRVENIARCPMDFQPGEGTGYSAIAAFDVLGRIVELVTGKELAVYLNESIFAPLDMTDTTFWPTAEQASRIPRLYKRPKDVLEDAFPDNNSANPHSFNYPCGSAGLHSTLHDYDRFVQMLANGGSLDGARILNPETIHQMASRCETDPDSYTWGLSMNVFTPAAHPTRSLADGVFGWSGAFGTHFFIDPVNDISMTFMVNRADINGASSYVSHAIEEAIFKGLDLKVSK